MTFKFDPQAAPKRRPTPANPAKSANPARSAEPISNISKLSNPSSPNGWGYTADDLDDMDRLLRELAQLESWTPEELSEMLDQRRRMAPARVPELLRTLKKAQEQQLSTWPEPPIKRAEFRLTTLTVIEGGKSESDRPGSSKTPEFEKGAA